MRLPGSHNSKGGDWLDVTNLVTRDNRYSLEKLEAWLASATVLLRRLPVAGHSAAAIRGRRSPTNTSSRPRSN